LQLLLELVDHGTEKIALHDATTLRCQIV